MSELRRRDELEFCVLSSLIRSFGRFSTFEIDFDVVLVDERRSSLELRRVRCDDEFSLTFDRSDRDEFFSLDIDRRYRESSRLDLFFSSSLLELDESFFFLFFSSRWSFL